MTPSHRRARIVTAIATAAFIAGAGSLVSPASAASNAAKSTVIAVKTPGKPKVACESRATAKAQAKCAANQAAKKAAHAAKKAAKKAAHKAAKKAAKRA